MWRFIKGVGVDFVAKDHAPYATRLTVAPRLPPNYAAFATVSRPTIPVTEAEVSLSLTSGGLPLVNAEFQALFGNYTQGAPYWHLEQVSETQLPMARFEGPRLVPVARIPAVIATVIKSEPSARGDEALSVSTDPESGNYLVEETRVSHIRIAVCAIVPGPDPKRVLLWAESSHIRERLRFKLASGRKLEEYYPTPNYFDERGNSVVAVMSTLIEGASLLVR